jgi:hypothetical protein
MVDGVFERLCSVAQEKEGRWILQNLGCIITTSVICRKVVVEMS